MSTKRENIVIGVILLAISLGYGYMITQLPTRNLPNTLGIDAMPRVFCIILASLSVMLIVSGIIGVRKPEAVKKEKLSWPHIRGVVLVFAILVAYIILIDVVGFLIVTPLTMFALMYLEGVRKYPSMIITSVVTTAAVYGLFRYVFEVSITGLAFL